MSSTPGIFTKDTLLSDFFFVPEPLSSVESTQKVMEITAVLSQNGILNSQIAQEETSYFINNLGLNPWFIRNNAPNVTAEIITALYASKIMAKVSGQFKLSLSNNSVGHAVYAIPSDKLSRHATVELESEIETRFLGEGSSTNVTTVGSSGNPGVAPNNTAVPSTASTLIVEPERQRLRCYRSDGTIEANSARQLRVYLLDLPSFLPNAPKESKVENLEQFEAISDQNVLPTMTDVGKAEHQSLLNAAVKRGLGVEVKSFIRPETQEGLVLVAYKQGSTHSFFSALTELYRSLNLIALQKDIHQYSNSYTLLSIYFKPRESMSTENFTANVERFRTDIMFVYVLPRTSVQSLFSEGKLSIREVAYAYAGWKFAYHFLSRFSTEYKKIGDRLQKSSREYTLLKTMKMKMAKDTFTESRIKETMLGNVDLMKLLYQDFESLHNPLLANSSGKDGSAIAPSKRLGMGFLTYAHYANLLKQIEKASTTDLDESILKMFLVFNHHILRTNFYQDQKVSLSFRFDPTFLDTEQYPKTPFAVFFVIGAEFRAFHCRFAEIARGGVRIVMSRNAQAFNQNLPLAFDEGYNLSMTQQLKNKDIPEGGAKGVILVALDHQTVAKARTSFHKYVDGLLDLLLPSAAIVDYLKKQEILFLGPDEGTADLMNWASEHARLRGAPFWKAFTTGKSPERGGIPHDLYGMTTRGVHAYVLGILAKMGVDERTVTKLQTGGPDGDLGSNEILISNDITIAVVDGGGVLYDPDGLDRTELCRLAKARVLSRHFDLAKLGPRGLFVDVDFQEPFMFPPLKGNSSKIPVAAGQDGPETVSVDGVVSRRIDSGLKFRNEFHLMPQSSAQLFVPCGGRPHAVSLSNVDRMFDATTGAPRFKWIVEGANLFFTQDARLELEQKGVLVIKDSSANKGGVTSSSCEVLVALALTDEEFRENMCVHPDGSVPAFYSQYVSDVQKIIEKNAREEFECLWRENKKSGGAMTMSELSDAVSNKIDEHYTSLVASSLYENEALRISILRDACPPTLLNLVGLINLLKRVPANYLRALVASFVASNFVYQHGLDGDEFAMYRFFNRYLPQ